MMVGTLREATQLLLDRFGDKKFQTIFIKPPWDHGRRVPTPRRVGGMRARPLALSLPHLRTLPLYPLGRPSSWLFLYAPTGVLPEALALMREWGFPYEAAFAWQPHWDQALGTVNGEDAPPPEAKSESPPESESGSDKTSPVHMETKITDQVVNEEDDPSEELEDTEDTSDASEKRVDGKNTSILMAKSPNAPKDAPKDAPAAFLLVGKRTRKSATDAHGTAGGFDRVAMRIMQLKRQGVPKLRSVQELIEFCCPPSYLELFARSNRKGWSYWGFEAELIYPGWLDDARDQHQDVMFELPDLIAKPVGIDHIEGVTAKDGEDTPLAALLPLIESEEEAAPSESEASGGEADALALDSLELSLSAGEQEETVLPLDLAEEQPEMSAQSDDQAEEAAQPLSLSPQAESHDASESQAEDAELQREESLEDVYQTAFEQVSTDHSDRKTPPIGETVPFEDIVPLEKLMNQEEEAEEPDAQENLGAVGAETMPEPKPKA